MKFQKRKFIKILGFSALAFLLPILVLLAANKKVINPTNLLSINLPRKSIVGRIIISANKVKTIKPVDDIKYESGLTILLLI